MRSDRLRMPRLGLRPGLLQLAVIGLACVASEVSVAERFTPPEVRKQFDLRLERFLADGLDLGPVDHVGRVRARVPLRRHSVELIVPWIYLQESDELDPDAPSIELGNITLGLGLHESRSPVRFSFLLGLPTGSFHGSSRRISPAGLYGSLAKYVPEFELYSAVADGFFRAEMQRRLFARGDLRLDGDIALVLRRIPSDLENEFEADFVGGLGAESTRDEVVFAAGIDFRIVTDAQVENQLEADLTLGIGLDNGPTRTSLQLRVPIDELRRDALPIGLGVQVAFLPPDR